MKLYFLIWVIANAIAALALLWVINKRMCPPPCDSCKHLRQRRSSGWCSWKYECHRHGNFDKAPTYCSDYKLRKSEEETSTESLVECGGCRFFEPFESVQGMYGICHKHANIRARGFCCNAGERIGQP